MKTPTNMKKPLFFLLFFPLLLSCQSSKKDPSKQVKYLYKKTESEWKAELSKMAFYVLRQGGTERAFSGQYDKFYEKGVYQCAACATTLYQSQYKYESGSGWPSFDRGEDENIEYDVDYKLGYARTELKCNRCGGHLGHMFNDGPRNTTGKRHCINSAALSFISETNE